MPREPTAAMHGAGDGVICNALGNGKGTWLGGRVWKAMLSAAPSAASPSPAAAEPVAWTRTLRDDMTEWREEPPTNLSGSGWIPLYLHPAPANEANVDKERLK